MDHILEKTITINLTNPHNATVAAVGCDGQDKYIALCALLATIKKELKNPDMIELMVKNALCDIDKMEENI